MVYPFQAFRSFIQSSQFLAFLSDGGSLFRLMVRDVVVVVTAVVVGAVAGVVVAAGGSIVPRTNNCHQRCMRWIALALLPMLNACKTHPYD